MTTSKLKMQRFHDYINVKKLLKCYNVYFTTILHTFWKIRKERLKEENIGSHIRYNASELVLQAIWTNLILRNLTHCVVGISSYMS